MNTRKISLTVLADIVKDGVASAFFDYLKDGEGFGKFLHEIYERGAENDLSGYFLNLILSDENAFSKTCARGMTPSRYLVNAYKDDICAIFSAITEIDDCGKFCKGRINSDLFNLSNLDCTINNLAEFYRTHGYGIFIDNKAFTYSDGKLIPVKNPSRITLEELKDYEYEKKVTGDNVHNFVIGLPYLNMLLYGDRGTGKSSTIHALLNKFCDEGLRLIELNKDQISLLPSIRDTVADMPLKFIVFIDDLSLGENDGNLSALKANLEGSVSCGTGNVMIVATSNRRHIVKESFSDRENSVHPSDSLAEQLSLSDRFGLTVMFSDTDKAKYLSIVKQLAADFKLKTDEQTLFSLAERWALAKGGRSPRHARQFVNLAYSCEKNGNKIDF